MLDEISAKVDKVDCKNGTAFIDFKYNSKIQWHSKMPPLVITLFCLEIFFKFTSSHFISGLLLFSRNHYSRSYDFSRQLINASF